MSVQHVAGSFRLAWPGTIASELPAADAERHARLTVWFARPQAANDAFDAARLGATKIAQRRYADRSRHAPAASNGEANLIAHCTLHDVTVVARHWRSIVVSGRLGDLARAFDAAIDLRHGDGTATFRHRTGWLSAPSACAAEIGGIFGFEEWPHSPRIGATSRDRTPLRAEAVAARYRFPTRRGTGQTIGIVSYATSYREDDYALAMHKQRIEREPPVRKHVDGERAAHHPSTTADVECATDVQIAAALAPGARIVIYEAPHSERGLLDAIRTAIFDEADAPSVLSISYGIVERAWTRAALDILDDLFVAAALRGISVFVSSGDNGAELDERDVPHVNAPASSPFVLACGATKLHDDGTPHEAAWHRTGGGFGRAPVPPWQHSARAWADRHGVPPRRGVPDVAGQCDPGFVVYLRGEELAMHGTSTVAPMWAALAARINEAAVTRYGSGATIGFFAPLLYATSGETMRAVTAGGNGRYEARADWNPCVGLGVPNGHALERALLD